MSIDQPSSCSVTMNPSDRREINSDRYTAVKLLPERGDPAGARYTPAPAGMTLGLLAGVQFRGIRGLDARLAQRRLEGLGPRAVVVGLLQGVVDEFAELGVAVLVTDAVANSSTTPCRRRSEEHTSELQSRENLVCRLLLE